MLVFWDKRLALLATPKTGSTAIAHALESLAAVSIQRPPGLKHTNVARYHRFIGPYLETQADAPFEVVALMREPRDWLGSWYRYRQRDDLGVRRKQTKNLSFDQFVQDWCSDHQPPHAQVGAQSQFLKPRNGKGLDRLFRYESIDRFVDFLEDRLGCAITLPRMNVSPLGETALSPETEALLHSKAAADFALYAALAEDGTVPD